MSSVEGHGRHGHGQRRRENQQYGKQTPASSWRLFFASAAPSTEEEEAAMGMGTVVTRAAACAAEEAVMGMGMATKLN